MTVETVSPTKETEPQMDRRVGIGAIAVLCAIVLFSAYTSFSNLDFSLDSDEFYHALAARSYLRDGSLRLGPGLHEYTRSRLTTLLVAVSFRVFGESETAARIPSAAFACLGVVLAFVVGRSFFWTSVGLWAAGITAFMPIFIEHARMCRMYAHSWFFTLLTAFLLFCVCDHVYRCSQEESGKWRRFWRWILSRRGAALVIASATAAAIMVHLHTISLALLPGVAAYVLYLVLLCVRRTGLARTAFTPLFILSAAVVVLVLAGVLASGQGFRLLVTPFTQIAEWAEGVDESPMRYHRALRDQGPLLYGLFPLGLLLACARGRRQGIYCSLVFVVALGLLLLFRWKEPRYLFVHLGMYGLLCAVAADMLSRQLMDGFSAQLGERRLGISFTAAAITGACVLTGVPQTALWPLRVDSRGHHRDALEYVRRHWKDGDKVATLLPTHALYYLGRVDYVLEIVDRRDKGSYPSIGGRDELIAASMSGRLWIVISGPHVDQRHRLQLIAPEVVRELQKLTPVYDPVPGGIRVYLVKDISDAPL